MPSIHTFVVKILLQRPDSQALHGLLSSVATGDQFPFADGETLLALLRSIAGGQDPVSSLRTAGTAGDTAQKRNTQGG